MKAYEIMEGLYALADQSNFEDSCDTLKAGNPNVDVSKVAVTMFATPNVIREASAWGAQLLITHEPTYYNHMDVPSCDGIESEKRKLVEGSNLTIYRFHDCPHDTTPDIIAAGELREMGLAGDVELTEIFDLVRVHLEQPLTALELAKIIEERLNIKHLRICGALHTPSTKISLMCGAPGELHVFEELKREECQILLVGETCEWMLGEYARDAAQLGYNKALIIMGHVGSERDGMKYTADIVRDKYPELEVKYFECGEVYGYTS